MNNISNSHKLIAGTAITALMIISMLAALPLATGSHTATIEVTPTEAKGDSRVLFEVDVTNNSASPDNIKKVYLDTDLTEPIAGDAAGENIENAADNLSNASDLLSQAAGYLKDASAAKLAAGSSIADMEEDLEEAQAYLAGVTGWSTVSTKLGAAKFFLRRAGNELASEPENIDYVSSELVGAAGLISQAGAAAPMATVEDNLKAAANYLENGVADNLLAGDFYEANMSLMLSAEALDNAGNAMKDNANPNVKSAGDSLINAAKDENSAASNLSRASENLIMVGRLFEDRSNSNPENAGFQIGIAGIYLTGITSIENAGWYLAFSGDLMARAGRALMGPQAENTIDQDIFRAGENLVLSAESIDNAGKILMKALGGDHLQHVGSDPGYLDSVGENMRNSAMLDLDTAASMLEDTATHLGLAADVLRSVGQKLQETPDGWVFTSSMPTWTATPSTGENTLAPGESATFPVILRTDGTADETITVYTRDTANATDDASFTINVDNEAPKLTGRVYQSMVGEDNLVGNVYNDGKATVEITANEELSSLGTVKLVADGENVMDITMSSTDDMVFTGTFDVGEWDDNNLAIWVEGATDTYGQENSFMDNLVYFVVDTTPPVFLDNGLVAARDNWATEVLNRVQSPENVWVTDNAEWVINGYVEDNDERLTGPAGLSRLEAYVNGTKVETGTIIDNWFSADDVDMGSEGLKTIMLTLTDKTGNSVSNEIDNIFYDTSKASIGSLSPSDGTLTNDNKIGVSAIVSDSGIGIDNAMLKYDNEDGVLLAWTENYPASATLENDTPWTAIDEDLDAWPEGEHTIWVYASDGLYENANDTWTFEIDVTPPMAPGSFNVEDPDTGAAIGSITDQNNFLITGTGEPGSTITLFQGRNGTQVGSTTVDSTGSWSIEVTVDEDGTFTWYAQATDKAGNDSIKTRVRTQTVDTQSPTVQITAPQDGLTTGNMSETVQATVSDEITEAKNMRVSLRSPEYTIPEGSVTVLEDGTLAVDVPLREGSNLITVVARDEAGNVGSDQITVERTVSEARNWAMWATIGAIIAIILAAIAILRRSA